MKKFITTILIIGMVLSLNLNLLLPKPKTAQATDLGGSLLTYMKEIALDAVASIISNLVLKPLEQKIIAWGQGKTSETNIPFAITDYVQYFKDAAALGAAKFINQEFANTFNEVDKFEKEIKNTLDSIGIGTNVVDLPTYSQYAKPTLKTDLGANYQKFIDSGYSLLQGGQDAWFSLMKPENNIFGQILMAQNAKQEAMDAQKEAADKQTASSGGYKNETATTQTDTQACEEGCKQKYGGGGGTSDQDKCNKCQTSCNTDYDSCFNTGQKTLKECQNARAWCISQCPCEIAAPEYTLESCLAQCPKKTTGTPIQTAIKNLGSDIHKQMENALGADMARLINVSEITQLIGILFSSLLNKTINGLGLYSQTKNTTPQQIQRNQLKQNYSYLKATQKVMTAEDLKHLDETILNGILKAMQQLSRSVVECNDSDKEMKYDDFAKNASDVLSSYVEAYYAGSTGLNLQPDFEVLDSPVAPFTVYGYSYGEMPASKIPTSCRSIITQAKLGSTATCKDIISGLEPNYSSKCADCLYDHDALNCPPDPKPPLVEPIVVVPSAALGTQYISKKLPALTEDQINAKQDFFNKCYDWYWQVGDRCGDCLKKADEQCSQDDPTEKNKCILDVCNNYGDLNDHITGKIVHGLDFYKKCLIEEQKDACFTCLKEYFVPDYYCGTITDYVRRAITKYPAVLYYERSGNDWESYWVGPFDKILADARGGFCPNNDDHGSLPVDLICRIMPDYIFNGARLCDNCYQNASSTRPIMTKEELNDITDFRPSETDCGNQRINVGGHDPLAAIGAGVMYSNAKCCASLHAGEENAKYYVGCIGSGPETAVAPPPPPLCLCGQGSPECCCAEGWRPVVLTRTGYTNEGYGGYGGDCSDAGLSLDNTYKYFMHMNNDDTTTDIAFIAAGGCKEADETLNNTDQTKIDPEVWLGDIGDGLPDVPPNEPDVTTFPSGVAWSHTGTPGEKAQFCIQNVASNNYIAGVYHNDNQDIDSGIQICQQCLETDTDYPYYNTPYDQCTGKPDPLEVPAGCE